MVDRALNEVMIWREWWKECLLYSDRSEWHLAFDICSATVGVLKLAAQWGWVKPTPFRQTFTITTDSSLLLPHWPYAILSNPLQIKQRKTYLNCIIHSPAPGTKTGPQTPPQRLLLFPLFYNTAWTVPIFFTKKDALNLSSYSSIQYQYELDMGCKPGRPELNTTDTRAGSVHVDDCGDGKRTRDT